MYKTAREAGMSLIDFDVNYIAHMLVLKQVIVEVKPHTSESSGDFVCLFCLWFGLINAVVIRSLGFTPRHVTIHDVVGYNYRHI